MAGEAAGLCFQCCSRRRTDQLPDPAVGLFQLPDLSPGGMRRRGCTAFFCRLPQLTCPARLRPGYPLDRPGGDVDYALARSVPLGIQSVISDFEGSFRANNMEIDDQREIPGLSSSFMVAVKNSAKSGLRSE